MPLDLAGRAAELLPVPPRPGAHKVVVLALDGVYPFELGIPHRVLGCADGRYEVRSASLDGGSVRTDADLSVTPGHGPEALACADTVVIPPYALSWESAATPDPRAVAALTSLRPGTRLVSICTGAFLLAAAGFLDGRRATTHWALAEHFRALYPRVELDVGVLYVDHWDVLTSAGAASGVDVCLHLVRHDHGSELANQVARACVVPPFRDGGQAQYIEQPLPPAGETGTGPTRDWALRHLELPLSLAQLAAHASMSTRTFARRFQEETGMSPGRWLSRQRLRRARRLLESSDLSVDRIAHEVGFATATSLRRHLAAETGVSPAAYRRTFRLTTAGGFPVPVSTDSSGQ
ncbi:transcriptional regulator GlxA family with amidase domain [Crossiella equi]|uniref:Transcriptional regulator GlxA family with amidase domain n=1 Tax=Crossiella equi TaxID=130796 RepID=A0ABS5A5K7_9PSEU|nr:helix-turn-helix domain-containing protein [Crossiella equi]MBP2471878.1 transcriptional regulator GlxA family with amidase domain [Crossiella equi]